MMRAASEQLILWRAPLAEQAEVRVTFLNQQATAVPDATSHKMRREMRGFRGSHRRGEDRQIFHMQKGSAGVPAS